MKSNITDLQRAVATLTSDVDSVAVSVQQPSAFEGAGGPTGVEFFDMVTEVAGGANLRSYAGPFLCDGYIYYPPANEGGDRLVRIPEDDFTPSGVQFMHLTSFNAAWNGYHGGCCYDGHAYLFPSQDLGSKNSHLLKLDTNDFSLSGITDYDMTTKDNGLKGFYSGFLFQQRIYLAPYNNGADSGLMAEVDLTSTFDAAGTRILDLAGFSTSLKGYFGGFGYDSGTFRHIYFCPHFSGSSYHSHVARVDLDAWPTISMLTFPTQQFGEAYEHNGYGYFLPFNDMSNLNRLDLHDFSASGITTLNLGSINGLLSGFWGGKICGNALVIAPYKNVVPWHGDVARIDLSSSFFTASAVSFVTLTDANSHLKGFSGVACGNNGWAYLGHYRHDGEDGHMAVRIRI